jgi:CheY-like chemotaxis protein
MKREAAPPLRGVHVLLVCDDAERRELFKETIDYGGAFTSTVESTARALRVMERLQVNVLVVETNVDERRACIAAVRREPRAVINMVPAIALTSSFEDRESVLAAGFQTHMAMPVIGAELCDAIAKLIGRG